MTEPTTPTGKRLAARHVDGVTWTNNITTDDIIAIAALVEAALDQTDEWHADEVHPSDCQRPICVAARAYREATR